MDALLSILAQLTAIPGSISGDAFSGVRILENLLGQSPIGLLAYFLWNERKALVRDNGELQKALLKKTEDSGNAVLTEARAVIQENAATRASLDNLTEAVRAWSGIPSGR